MTMTMTRPPDQRTASWPDVTATGPRLPVHVLAPASAAELPFSVQRVNGALIIRARQPVDAPPNAQPLTERERTVLALVAEGFSNKTIGHQLSITERTVKSHLTYIMIKLRASDRTHAVVTAVRLGWLAI